ncbi:MAG: hypothetical protein AAF957_09430 [Planctomycetota bacterium]
MSNPPLLESRDAHRRRTALLSLASGWIVGMGGWTAVFIAELIRSGLSEWLQVPVWLAIFGAFQLVFMLPGAVPFWIWHRRAPLSAQSPWLALPMGGAVGLATMVLWAAALSATLKSPMADFLHAPELCVASLVGAATFAAGARYRSREPALVLRSDGPAPSIA